MVASRIPVTSLTTSFSAASDVAVSKSPHCVATLPRPFKAMDNGARAPRARASSTCRVLSADPAVEVPRGHGRHLGENPPLQPLLPGHLITEEGIHCPPQGRPCCRTPLDDHRRQTVEEEVTRPRSPRRLRGRSCRPGNFQQ